MAHPILRELLHKAGLLEFSRRVRRVFNPPAAEFAPATPHLLIAVHKALRHLKANGLADGGEYLEFGVYRGFTLWFAQALAKDLAVRDMRFFGFDSFEGLPAPSGIDAADSQKDSFVRGAYSASKNYVEGWLKGLGADMGAITLVEGFFDRTLTPQLREKFRLRRCALCVIDCDLYASTKDALAFVEPLLAEGTIVLFDDWRSYANSPEAGEQRAWREFLQAHPRFKAEPFTEFHDHGMGFVVRVRSDD